MFKSGTHCLNSASKQHDVQLLLLLLLLLLVLLPLLLPLLLHTQSRLTLPHRATE
jgi:hypothetical protein